jgi:NAD kinase
LFEKNFHVVAEDRLFKYITQETLLSEQGTKALSLLERFNPEDKSIDLIITFGGDGLLLHCNTLFANRNIPPIMCFDFGSLGFLSPFFYEDFRLEVNIQVFDICIDN